MTLSRTTYKQETFLIFKNNCHHFSFVYSPSFSPLRQKNMEWWEEITRKRIRAACEECFLPLRFLVPSSSLFSNSSCVALFEGKHSIPFGPPGGASGKEPASQCRIFKRLEFDPWVRKIPRKRAWQCTPLFLPGEPHGQRSLAGYSPWSRKESDTT